MAGGSNDLSSALHKTRKRSNPFSTSHPAHRSAPFPDRQRKGLSSRGAAALRTANAVDKGVLGREDFFTDGEKLMGGGGVGEALAGSSKGKGKSKTQRDGDERSAVGDSGMKGGTSRSRTKKQDHRTPSNQPLITDALGPLRTTAASLAPAGSSNGSSTRITLPVLSAGNLTIDLPKQPHTSQHISVSGTPTTFQLSIDINDILDDPNLLGLQRLREAGASAGASVGAERMMPSREQASSGDAVSRASSVEPDDSVSRVAGEEASKSKDLPEEQNTHKEDISRQEEQDDGEASKQGSGSAGGTGLAGDQEGQDSRARTGSPGAQDEARSEASGSNEVNADAGPTAQGSKNVEQENLKVAAEPPSRSPRYHPPHEEKIDWEAMLNDPEVINSCTPRTCEDESERESHVQAARSDVSDRSKQEKAEEDGEEYEELEWLSSSGRYQHHVKEVMVIRHHPAG